MSAAGVLRMAPLKQATGRPPPRARELAVLAAFGDLPDDCRTPSAAVTALMRGGLDMPHSTIAQTLLRLERKGAIQMRRTRS